MLRKKTVKLAGVLRQLFSQRGISIKKIILFGSYASGKAKRDSDIDIIVVSPDFRGKDIFEKVELVSGVHRLLVKRANRPVDIMYYSDREWKRGRSLVINAARREGVAIYG